MTDKCFAFCRKRIYILDALYILTILSTFLNLFSHICFRTTSLSLTRLLGKGYVPIVIYRLRESIKVVTAPIPYLLNCWVLLLAILTAVWMGDYWQRSGITQKQLTLESQFNTRDWETAPLELSTPLAGIGPITSYHLLFYLHFHNS